jgi:hypothetical protein
MEFLDKVNEVAGEMGDVARKWASQVQAKFEQTQLRRRADDAARRLGYAVYRERTGGVSGGAEADALVAEIRDAEAQIEAAETVPARETDVPPASSVQRPATPPASGVQRPATPPASGVQRPATRPASDVEKPVTPPPAPGQATGEAAGE